MYCRACTALSADSRVRAVWQTAVQLHNIYSGSKEELEKTENYSSCRLGFGVAAIEKKKKKMKQRKGLYSGRSMSPPPANVPPR